MNPRLVLVGGLLAALMFGPSAAVAQQGRGPGGEGSAPAQHRTVDLGSHSSDVRGSAHRGGGFGEGRQGVEGVRFGVEGGAPASSGSGPTGPAGCGDGPLHIPPWAEEAPEFAIVTSPQRAGVVAVDTRFRLDGEFDGHAVMRRVPAYYWHSTSQGFDAAGNFLGCALDPAPVNLTVRVHYWPMYYVWDFGDGSDVVPIHCGDASGPSDCTFGVRREDEARIHHIYRVSSADDFEEGGYMVVATVGFALGIGPDNDTDPVIALVREVEDRAWLRFQVREVQSTLVN